MSTGEETWKTESPVADIYMSRSARTVKYANSISAILHDTDPQVKAAVYRFFTDTGHTQLFDLCTRGFKTKSSNAAYAMAITTANCLVDMRPDKKNPPHLETMVYLYMYIAIEAFTENHFIRDAIIEVINKHRTSCSSRG